jgi:hypothetical protein
MCWMEKTKTYTELASASNDIWDWRNIANAARRARWRGRVRRYWAAPKRAQKALRSNLSRELPFYGAVWSLRGGLESAVERGRHWDARRRAPACAHSPSYLDGRVGELRELALNPTRCIRAAANCRFETGALSPGVK